MEILFDRPARHLSLLREKKIDKDEKLVRRSLVRVWIRVLEKYAMPGMEIPSPDILRQELLEIGVEEAVDALCSAHWFLFPFMIEKEIKEKVEKELARFDLPDFIEDVKMAQYDLGLLEHLREKIYHYVMN